MKVHRSSSSKYFGKRDTTAKEIDTIINNFNKSTNK